MPPSADRPAGSAVRCAIATKKEPGCTYCAVLTLVFQALRLLLAHHEVREGLEASEEAVEDAAAAGREHAPAGDVLAVHVGEAEGLLLLRRLSLVLHRLLMLLRSLLIGRRGQTEAVAASDDRVLVEVKGAAGEEREEEESVAECFTPVGVKALSTNRQDQQRDLIAISSNKLQRWSRD